jgi:mono/diheme cytochrome c family protein
MRTSRFLAALAACTTIMLLPCASAQPRADAGQREFLAKCAVCHGEDAKGGGPYAELLKRALPDLTTLARRSGGVYPAGLIFETIEGAGTGHGPRGMPVWGLDYTVQAAEALPDMPYNQAVFVRARINALVEHLRRLQTP